MGSEQWREKRSVFGKAGRRKKEKDQKCRKEEK